MRRRAAAFYETPDEGLINLTPLIDVVFVVLIMFILVAPLIETEHIALAPASKVEREEVSRNGIKIVVKKDNAITVDGKSVSIKNLTAALKKLKDERPSGKPTLIQDANATFGMFQQIKNCAEHAGFDTLEIVVKSE